MKATEFDRRFDAGEEISAEVVWTKAHRPNLDDLTPEGLAKAVRQWRGDKLPISAAARLLGIRPSILEAIEQGRGFRYPKMLLLAMQAAARRK